MNQYETVLILTPVLTEEMVREAVLKFEKVLKENGAELVHQAHWVIRKLAYPIRKKATGFYHLYEFKATGLAVDKLELELRRDERILRFLTVSLDKYAVTYNESRRRPKTAKEEVNP
jgi:small subunit ribosomal protein S6